MGHFDRGSRGLVERYRGVWRRNRSGVAFELDVPIYACESVGFPESSAVSRKSILTWGLIYWWVKEERLQIPRMRSAAS